MYLLVSINWRSAVMCFAVYCLYLTLLIICQKDSDEESGEEKEKLSDEETQQEAGVIAGEPFDPSFKVATWERTILGK